VETTDELTDFPKILKSFAQAFSKACGFQRQSLWWVLRAKPLTFLSFQSGGFYLPLKTFFINHLTSVRT